VPEARHQAELVETLGLLRVPAGKAEEAAASIPGARHVATTAVTRTIEASRALALDLVMMGPNAFHRERDQVAVALAALPEPIAVTIAVSVVELELPGTAEQPSATA